MRFIFLILITCLTGCGKPSDSHETTQVVENLLVIGDSISLGYLAPLQKDLETKYNVVHVKDESGADQNAQGTTFTLININRWLRQAPSHLDVIIWNNGVWNALDPSINTENGPANATDLDTYKSELIEIAKILNTTDARIIFVTTTDLPAPGFFKDRDLEENKIAKSVLPSMGIEVFDVNELVRTNPQLHLGPNNIHFNEEGYELLAQVIAGAILINQSSD